mmetsp:Transcript_13595/g.20594  ORF Transcript_13595/g.20594 Transcript_13595/m.20594 type:complete len:334 (+) Transcript_13595:67-1068(+)
MNSLSNLLTSIRRQMITFRLSLKRRLASVHPAAPWILFFGGSSTIAASHHVYHRYYKLRLKELSLPEYGIEKLLYRGEYTLEPVGEEGLLLTFTLPESFFVNERRREGKRHLPRPLVRLLAREWTISLLIQDHAPPPMSRLPRNKQKHPDLPDPPLPMNTIITSTYLPSKMAASDSTTTHPYYGISVSPTQEFHVVTNARMNDHFRSETAYDKSMSSSSTSWGIHEYTEELSREARRLLCSLRPSRTAKPVSYDHCISHSKHVRLALMAMMGMGQPISLHQSIYHWKESIALAQSTPDLEASLKSILLKQPHVSPSDFIAFAQKNIQQIETIL